MTAAATILAPMVAMSDAMVFRFAASFTDSSPVRSILIPVPPTAKPATSIFTPVIPFANPVSSVAFAPVFSN